MEALVGFKEVDSKLDDVHPFPVLFQDLQIPFDGLSRQAKANFRHGVS
jgi:hypothetical protein